MTNDGQIFLRKPSACISECFAAVHGYVDTQLTHVQPRRGARFTVAAPMIGQTQAELIRLVDPPVPDGERSEKNNRYTDFFGDATKWRLECKRTHRLAELSVQGLGLEEFRLEALVQKLSSLWQKKLL